MTLGFEYHIASANWCHVTNTQLHDHHFTISLWYKFSANTIFWCLYFLWGIYLSIQSCGILVLTDGLLWGKVFKNRPSKICGRRPLKKLKWSGLPRQTISTNSTWSILEYLDPYESYKNKEIITQKLCIGRKTTLN